MGILSVLLSIFNVVVKPFKMFSDLLTTNPKKAAIIVLIIIAILIGWRINHHINKLNDQVVKTEKAKQDAIKERDRLQVDLNLAVEVNKSNQLIIDRMKGDQAADAQRIADLSTAVVSNNTKYNKLLVPIQNSAKADDGPVAKVLADTIKRIQSKGAQK